jgi:hypothetical protein
VYLKSVCVQDDPLMYEDAEIQCQNKGMKLFRPSSVCEKSALLTFVDTKLSNATSVWFDDGSGRCVSLSNINGSFKARDSSCTRKMISACEFRPVGPVTSTQNPVTMPSTTAAITTPVTTTTQATTTTPAKTTNAVPVRKF